MSKNQVTTAKVGVGMSFYVEQQLLQKSKQNTIILDPKNEVHK